MSGPAGFGAPGFHPPGCGAPGCDPAAAPAEVLDLDQDLVAFVRARLAMDAAPFMVAPGPTAPSVTYTLIAEEPVMRLAGMAGLARRTYQVDFRATHPAVPAQLAERLRAAIQGYRGPFGTNTVRRATYRRVPNWYDGAANGGASGTFRACVELSIWYHQARPSD